MQVAAAGLGSVAEQRAWTEGYWAAVVERLPRLEAHQSLRAASVAITPYLWRFAFREYQKAMNAWQATARRFSGGADEHRGQLQRFKSWLSGVLGSGLRQE